MVIGVALALAGMLLIYLGVVDQPFKQLAKDFASGVPISVPPPKPR